MRVTIQGTGRHTRHTAFILRDASSSFAQINASDENVYKLIKLKWANYE